MNYKKVNCLSRFRPSRFTSSLNNFCDPLGKQATSFLDKKPLRFVISDDGPPIYRRTIRGVVSASERKPAICFMKEVGERKRTPPGCGQVSPLLPECSPWKMTKSYF